MTTAEKIQAAFRLGRVVEGLENFTKIEDLKRVLDNVEAVVIILSESGETVQGWDVSGKGIKGG